MHDTDDDFKWTPERSKSYGAHLRRLREHAERHGPLPPTYDEDGNCIACARLRLERERAR